MGVIAVNENDVKLVKSGAWANEMVGAQQKRREPADDDSSLGAGHQHSGSQPSVS